MQKLGFSSVLVQFFIVLQIVSNASTCSSFKKGSRINILNNGYENILIAIDDEVKENLEIIKNIKNSFNQASALLFNATR